MAENETPVPDPSDSEATRAAPQELRDGWGDAPSQIGPYRLVRRIGEGGMGEVWMAEQKEPIERMVALKLVKLGMDTRQFIARFESERQALALMEHPCIARVIDGGATETGRPFFVMEYVEGSPIIEYCDEHRLTIRQRLEVFVALCAGVQHAHQKGIIHRDLKPSNVLAAEVDGKPLPKIIDFGVAKATTQSLTDKTVHTVLGGMIGTPAYMSPEQAEITDDIDTRTDVYSLGAMLYELLAGERPFDAETLDSAGFDEMRRVIREVEPPRLSTRAGDSRTIGPTAESRRTEPRALRRRLEGDLDWIVMKAMSKDKERRYESPLQLALDIERHLASRPVIARPPSRSYRARRFVRRHRLGVLAASLVTVAIFGGSSAAVWQAFRATRAEKQALAEAERANDEAVAAQEVSDFLLEIFRVPQRASANTVTARELLDQGAERITDDLKDQPLLQARLIHTMGRAYVLLGLLDKAGPLLQQALRTREEELGSDNLDVAASLHELAGVYWTQGRFEQAEPLFKRSLKIRQTSLGPDHPDLVLSLNNLAGVYIQQGRLEEGVPLLERAVEIRERFPDPDQGWFLSSNLAMLYADRGRYEEAESLLRRALRLEEDRPGNAPGLILSSLGDLYTTQGRFEEAEPLYRRSLEILERLRGPNHYFVSLPLHGLGDLYRKQERFSESKTLFRRALTLREKTMEPDHPDLVALRKDYAALLRSTGRDDEADALLAQNNSNQP